MTTTCVTAAGLPVAQLFDNRIAIESRFITSAELAHALGLSEHTIRSWRKFRYITPKKLGRSVRWLLEEVLQELNKRRKPNEKSRWNS